MNWQKDLNLINDIFKEGPVVVFIWNNEIDWPVEFVSSNVEEFTGYSVDDWKEHKIKYSEIIHKEDRERVKNEVKTYSYELKLKRWRHKPYRILHKNGIIKWVDDHTYCIYDEGGSPIKYIGYVIDITQQYRLQKELEDEFLKYFSFFNHHSAPMLVVNPKTGQIVQANESAIKFYGYSKNQFTQLSIYDIIALSNDEVHSHIEDAQEFKKNYFQIPHKLRDNTIKEVEVYSSLIEIKNNPYLFLILHDVTEKVKLQKELEALNLKLEELLQKEIQERVSILKKFHALFNQNIFGVGIVYNNRLVDFNARLLQLMNLNENQVKEIDFFDIFIFKDTITQSNLVRDFSSIKFYPTMEVQLKYDPEKYFILFANPFIDIHTKNKIQFLVILYDITEKKKIEKEKQEQEQMFLHQSRLLAIGESLSAIAHQWRQPLNSIHLMIQYILELIKLNELNQDILKQTLSEAIEQIEFLSKTIDDFRDFYRYDLEQTEFSVLEELSKIKNLLSVQLENYNIKIIIEGEDFFIFGNSGLFKNAILNIISNAKDSILNFYKISHHDEGIIKIFLDKNKKSIQICDNGGGIKQEIMDKLFQPYVTTKSIEGSGLGLYITKIIFDKMKGVIRFWNKTHENGACFEISFRE